jgi:hypothetical protein
MNKYKKGLTPDEVAFIAINLSGNDANKINGIDLSCYLTVEAAITGVNETIELFGRHSETSTRQDDEKPNLCDFEIVAKLLNQALEIKAALVDETYRAHEYEHTISSRETILKIYNEYYHSHDEHHLWPEKTQLTKESIADWFADIGEKKISKKFRPHKKNVPINPFKQAL